MNIQRDINTCRNVIIMKKKWFCITGMCACSLPWSCCCWCPCVEPVDEPNWLEKFSCKCQDVPPTTTIHPSIHLVCSVLFNIIVYVYIIISRATAISCLRLCLCVDVFLVYLLVSVMIFRLYFRSSLCCVSFSFLLLNIFASTFHFRHFDCSVYSPLLYVFESETLED